jgi:hypothetical protein
MHPRATHRLKRADRPRQLALDRARLVHLLPACGEAERLLGIEHFIADLAAKLIAREAHAQLRQPVLRGEDRRAIRADLKRYVLRLQFLGNRLHRRGVEIGVEIGKASGRGPHRQHHKADDQRKADCADRNRPPPPHLRQQCCQEFQVPTRKPLWMRGAVPLSRLL